MASRATSRRSRSRPDDDDRRAQPANRVARARPSPEVAPVHDRHLSGHARLGWLGPRLQPTPHLVADPGEAQDDGGLEAQIDGAGQSDLTPAPPLAVRRRWRPASVGQVDEELQSRRSVSRAQRSAPSSAAAAADATARPPTTTGEIPASWSATTVSATARVRCPPPWRRWPRQGDDRRSWPPRRTRSPACRRRAARPPAADRAGDRRTCTDGSAWWSPAGAPRTTEPRVRPGRLNNGPSRPQIRSSAAEARCSWATVTVPVAPTIADLGHGRAEHPEVEPVRIESPGQRGLDHGPGPRLVADQQRRDQTSDVVDPTGAGRGTDGGPCVHQRRDIGRRRPATRAPCRSPGRRPVRT